MKRNLLKVLGLFLMLATFSSQKSVAQIELSGEWTATCVIEKTTESSISFCDFCPVSAENNNTELYFEPFKMVFENDYFELIIKDKSTMVDYKIEENLDNLLFTYNEKDYIFKVLHVFRNNEHSYILKGIDGMLIILDKIKDK
jgi:hypothetical protein